MILRVGSLCELMSKRETQTDADQRYKKITRSTIDSHLQQQTEKEWLKILEEVKIRYSEKAKIFKTAWKWKLGNTEGKALQETGLKERVQEWRRMPTW